MKYRDLRLSFNIADMLVTVLSIGYETILTPFPRHSHSKNSYELHYISEGYGTLISDGVSYELVPGTFYVTGPGVFHEQLSKAGAPMIEYGMYLRTSYERSAPADSSMLTFTEHGFWIGTADSVIPVLFEKIFKELADKALGYEHMLPALISELLLTITRMYRKDTAVIARASTNCPEDLTYLTIEEAFLYDYKTLTLSDLAARVNLGKRQTERLLQKHYNLTFSRKKTEARMSAAALSLENTQKSIGEISEELGFSSPEHFANAFKKYYSVTPAAYRKNHKSGL